VEVAFIGVSGGRKFGDVAEDDVGHGAVVGDEATLGFGAVDDVGEIDEGAVAAFVSAWPPTAVFRNS
jgi:hypothetical protein